MLKLLRRIFGNDSDTNLDRFVLYKTFSNQADAYIAKGVLETNGLDCFIDGEQLSSVYPSQLGFAQLRLYLRRGDFLMADQLLCHEEED